jgi:hypothetical protein
LETAVEAVRIDETRRQVQPRLHLLPRFRQILHRPLGWPLWVDAQSFDLADHIRVFPLPASAGETQLLEACEELRRRRLDPMRPLWEMWLLPGLAVRRVGLYLRMHHAIADGVAGLRPSGRCSTLPPMRPCRRRRRGRRRRCPRRVNSCATTCSGVRGDSMAPFRAWHCSVRTLRHARSAWPAWRELFAEERAPRTSLNHPIGGHRSLALIRSRLDLAKQIAHAH